MDKEVKKSKRSIGVFYHKTPGIKCAHTKRQALLDISKEVLTTNSYTRNYVSIESTVMNACKCILHIKNINTNKL